MLDFQAYMSFCKGPEVGKVGPGYSQQARNLSKLGEALLG